MQNHTTKKDIEKRRQEIENELCKYIRDKEIIQTNIEVIKNTIYKGDRDDFNGLMKQFNIGQSQDELDKFYKLLNEAWDYFPHKNLIGNSPIEKIMKNKEY